MEAVRVITGKRRSFGTRRLEGVGHDALVGRIDRRTVTVKVVGT